MPSFFTVLAANKKAFIQIIKNVFFHLDNFTLSSYNRINVCKPVFSTRGCTGFDGDFEVVEAIRGPGPRSKPDLKIKRRR